MIGSHLAEDLTPSEREVLRLMLQGLSVAEIASGTSHAESTIRTHVKHLKAKTGARKLPALVLWPSDHAECCWGLESAASG